MYAANATREIYPRQTNNDFIQHYQTNPINPINSTVGQWEPVRKQSYFFKDKSSIDVNNFNTNSNRNRFAKVWIWIGIALLYLIIISALVTILVLAPRYLSYNFSPSFPSKSESDLDLLQNSVPVYVTEIKSPLSEIFLPPPGKPIFRPSAKDPLYEDYLPRSDIPIDDINSPEEKVTEMSRSRMNNKFFNISQINILS